MTIRVAQQSRATKRRTRRAIRRLRVVLDMDVLSAEVLRVEIDIAKVGDGKEDGI